jgi:phytoene synthase
MDSKFSYCGAAVRAQDPDRFLLSMFAPAESREALWALFAFNLEIAKTREVVTETQLGLIRLQWWREAVGRIYDGAKPPEHEILRGLAQAIKAHDLPQAEFETLMYAREFDLEDVQPANLEGLLNYADFTSTPLLKLALRISGGAPEMEPVQPVAVNYALAGIIRAVPFHAGQRRCLLPEDLMRAAGLNAGALYTPAAAEKTTRRALAQVIETVGIEIVKDVAPQSRFLKAVQGLGCIYSSQVKRADYDVFHPRLQAPPAFKALRVALAAA